MSGLWEACTEPEKPTDPWVTWKPGCKACLFKAEVLLHMYPGDPVVERHVHRLRGWMDSDEKVTHVNPPLPSSMRQWHGVPLA